MPQSKESSGPRRHLILSGTGRSGTTFLMRVFTSMGLDTGFAKFDSPMEWDWRDPRTPPYIIKRPQFCDELPAFLEAGVLVDHAIIPFRNLRYVSESRRRRADEGGGPNANGGLFGTSDPEMQEEVLRQKFNQLMGVIRTRGIPHTIVAFDRINDVDYLFAALRPAFSVRYSNEFTEARLSMAHAEVTAYRNAVRDGF